MTQSEANRGIGRRQVLGMGGLAVAGAPLVGSGSGSGSSNSSGGGNRSGSGNRRGAGAAEHGAIPPDTRPGGAYDRFVGELAAQGRFCGGVLLSHRGRTVLSRSYGMADVEKGVPNREITAFNLSSAGKPFLAVALVQLAQLGKLQLGDPVGKHLSGFAPGIAGQVTIHHLLSGTSGLTAPDPDVQRVFGSVAEVHDYYEQRARQSTLTGVPGQPSGVHAEPEITIGALIVEAVTGTTYWAYVQEHVYRRAGMIGPAYPTRPQWLADPRFAHPYMKLGDGRFVDAIRHLDASSPLPDVRGENPGRAFIAAPGDGGFASGPDLVRFGTALLDGTLLDRPWADVLLSPKIPHGPTSFGAYQIPVSIVNGQWEYERAGGNPGVGANWTIYPDTGWVAVTLINRDTDVLLDLLELETHVITGAPLGGEAGG